MSGFRNQIRQVTYGAAANAGVLNTSLQELQGNDNYLRDRIDAADLGEALVRYDVTLNTATVVGTPVYWDADNSRFAPALAATAAGPGNVLEPAASALVRGVVLAKSLTNKGDVLLLGTAKVDLSAVVSGTVTAGQYYLSGTLAGKLVKTKPAAAIPVLFAYGDGYVTVLPSTRSFLDDHTHYSFELQCIPAGSYTPPTEGEIHTISSPNELIEGWLPADHEVFAGKAPSGAAFGYNLEANPYLLSVWPPIPIGAAQLLWDKGQNHVGATQVPLGADGLVLLNADGIWWMSNCYGDVPWPIDYVSGGSSSSQSLECPRDEQMRLTLSFIRMGFATNKSVVTSIRSLSTALQVLNCNGEPATVGDIYLRLLLSLLVDSDDSNGASVLKGFDGTAQKFTKGNVAEGLIAGTNITLTSTVSRLSDPEDGASPRVHQGLVTVAADSDPAGKLLYPAVVHVDDAIQRFDENIIYLSLMPDNQTGFRGRIDIPAGGLGSSPTVRLRFVCVATVTGTPPEITLTALRLPLPAEPTAVPSGDTAVTVNFPAVGAVTAGQYFAVTSDPITVDLGGSLFYTVSRAGDDGYSGEIGIIQHVAVVQ